jgi:hypothetical protein
MKSTSVKRGRPKKVAEPEQDDITKEALKGSHDAEKTEKLATPTPAGDPIAFINKVFHFKDGSTCRVYYSGCKTKPIDIYHKS